jgi:hypothetical protein
MKRLIPLVLVCAILAGISSCAHDCGLCPNLNYQTWITLQGFSDSDVTPLSLMGYVKGSNFSQYRSDTVFTGLANGSTNHSVIFIGNDSTDYVVVPNHLQTYQVSGMKYNRSKCNNCRQSDDIYTLGSYTLSGVGTVDPGLLITIQK